jgi:hypothetical protein
MTKPQETTPETETVQPRENDEPNSFGFAGDGTAPEPEPTSAKEGFGESIAVPAGDLTGAITGAIEEATTDEDADRPGNR